MKKSPQFIIHSLLLWLFVNFSINAQNTIISDYLKNAGDYAGIYNGKIESAYNSKLYENTPYYKSPDFTRGIITYKKNIYPDQQIRLDLYKEHLIILTPEKHYSVILDSDEVERVNLYDKTFIWENPSSQSGLKPGYYMLLFEGKSLKLLCKETYNIKEKQQTFRFDSKILYYLFFNGQYYSVKNKKSFIKIFPQYKKQIDTYIKKHKLNFKKEKEFSLNTLASYCQELLNSNDNN